MASTPEPVLVIDEQARLLLLNPAAVQVPGLILTAIEGRPIQEVVGSLELVELLTVPLTERISSREINLANGKIYYASVSPVVAEGRSVGRVCILRDITHFKELEQLKSDFVATVSHDLALPVDINARIRYNAADGWGPERSAKRLCAEDRLGRGKHDPAGEQPARPGPD